MSESQMMGNVHDLDCGLGQPDPDESPALQDRDIERIIDFMEEIGMRVEPWQAEAMRAIFRLPPNSVISVMHQRH